LSNIAYKNSIIHSVRVDLEFHKELQPKIDKSIDPRR